MERQYKTYPPLVKKSKTDGYFTKKIIVLLKSINAVRQIQQEKKSVSSVLNELSFWGCAFFG